jgi:hypothetical protein
MNVMTDMGERIHDTSKTMIRHSLRLRRFVHLYDKPPFLACKPEEFLFWNMSGRVVIFNFSRMKYNDFIVCAFFTERKFNREREI